MKKIIFIVGLLLPNLIWANNIIDSKSFEDYLIQFEGKRNIPYRDICDCQWNVGVAHRLNPKTDNLNRKYSHREIESFFQKDLAISIRSARRNINNFDFLSEYQQWAILNIIYSCGPNGFAKWIKFRAAVESCNFNLAQEEILNSQWVKQVQPSRKWSVYNQMK